MTRPASWTSRWPKSAVYWQLPTRVNVGERPEGELFLAP